VLFRSRARYHRRSHPRSSSPCARARTGGSRPVRSRRRHGPEKRARTMVHPGEEGRASMLEQQANERWEMSSSIDASAMVSRELASVQRAADGDHQAQAWLVHRVLATVRRAARSLADSASDADDAAPIALIEVLQSARSHRGLAPL